MRPLQYRIVSGVPVDAKLLKEVEDLNPSALPPSTYSREARIHGAHKYSQIGPDACAAILQGLFTGAPVTDLRACLVIDFDVKVGDMLEAFVNIRSNFGVTTH